MGIEGRLNITLATASGRVEQVGIESSRPLYAARVFEGKTVAETLKMLPMLFTICGTAQVCAGVRACEQALGVTPADGTECLRDDLVAMETMREHLWRILLDWPGFLDQAPEKMGMTGMLALQREHRQALTAGQDPFLLGGVEDLSELAAADVIEQAGFIMQQAVFGLLPSQWLEIDTTDQLQKWASSAVTVAARLLKYVMQQEWRGVGDCEVEALPIMQAESVQQQMLDDDFIRQPQWLGDCRETTCLSRVASPLLQQLRSQYGNGLLVRLVARLTELAQLSSKLSSPSRALTDTSSVKLQNPGIGQVAAARGQLLHRVQLENESIVRYQILAPTEWNFHPQGVVAKSLASVQGDVVQMTQQAKLLINAIDPCVGYELSISDA